MFEQVNVIWDVIIITSPADILWTLLNIIDETFSENGQRLMKMVNG